MKNIYRALAVSSFGPLLLTACGGGGGKDAVVSTPPTVTPPTTTAFQSRFGANFATAFNASPTAEPSDPAPGDVPAVNLTAEPQDN